MQYSTIPCSILHLILSMIWIILFKNCNFFMNWYYHSYCLFNICIWLLPALSLWLSPSPSLSLARIHEHTHSHTHAHTHIHKQTHIHTHTHTHMHTRTHMQKRWYLRLHQCWFPSVLCFTLSHIWCTNTRWGSRSVSTPWEIHLQHQISVWSTEMFIFNILFFIC